jgi:4-amino-4-deoxy-L-arabinose transferase-like glycosyltransferase
MRAISGLARRPRAGLYQKVVLRRATRPNPDAHRVACPPSDDRRASRTAVVAAVAIVLAFGCVSAAARFDAIALDRRIGLSDTAAYAEMGRNLAEGRGLVVRYISTFYYGYDRAIDRLDDHWPPLMGVLIAPFFAVLGVSAFHAKFPAVLMGTLGLPLAATWLGIAVSRRAWVGTVAGLLMIVNRQVFAESLTTLVDVTLAALLTAFCAALIAARSRPRLYVLAGALGVLAYYAKMSEVILVGLFPVLALLITGPRVVKQRWMYAGWAVLAAGILPWQLTNAVVYGSPLHSIQNHVSGFIALDVWEQAHYRPYWGEDLPQTSDRWTKYGERYWPLTRRQREEYVRMVLLGSDTGQADWYRLGPVGTAAFALLRGASIAPSPRRTEPDTPLMKQPEERIDADEARRAAAAWPALWARTLSDGATALSSGWRSLLDFIVAEHRATLVPNLLGGLYAACVLIGVPLRAWWRGSLAKEIRAWPRSFGIVAALVLLGMIHGILLIYFFSVGARFTFTALPVMAVLGCTGVAAIARRIAAALRPMLDGRLPDTRALRVRPVTIAGGVATLLLVVFAIVRAPELIAWQQAQARVVRGFRATPTEQLGNWIARSLPADAVVMDRQPWELRFYAPSGVKTVAMPWSPEDVRVTLGIAYWYGVTHVVPDPARPELTAYLERLGPGVTRLAAPVPVYALDWSAIPHGDVLPPHQATDARDGATEERGYARGS